MASWVRNRLSLGSSKNPNVINSREVSSQIDMSNWKIPKQKIEAIYQIGKFDFNTALSIKDFEDKLCSLLESNLISILPSVSSIICLGIFQLDALI